MRQLEWAWWGSRQLGASLLRCTLGVGGRPGGESYRSRSHESTPHSSQELNCSEHREKEQTSMSTAQDLRLELPEGKSEVAGWVPECFVCSVDSLDFSLYKALEITESLRGEETQSDLHFERVAGVAIESLLREIFCHVSGFYQWRWRDMKSVCPHRATRTCRFVWAGLGGKERSHTFCTEHTSDGDTCERDEKGYHPGLVVEDFVSF